MKRMLCVVAIIIAAASHAVGFEGRLVTRDGQALVGARIQVLGGRGTALADGEGRFRLDPSPRPPFESDRDPGRRGGDAPPEGRVAPGLG